MPKGQSTTPRRGRYQSKAPFDPSGPSGSALVLAQRQPLQSEPYTRGGSPIRSRGGSELMRSHSPGYALVPAEVEPFPSAYTRATLGKSEVLWQYYDGTEWQNFTDEEALRIEHSYAAGAGAVELPIGRGNRMAEFNFNEMTQDGRKIRRNEVMSSFVPRPKGFTDYSAQFVRRHNPKFNVHLEGFFGGTQEKGTITGSEAVCAEVVSTGHIWTGEKDGTMKIFNAKTGKRIHITDQKKEIYLSSLLEVPASDGTPTVWAGFTDAVIRVFSAVHPYEVKLTLQRHAAGARIHCLAPQIGGQCVFSGGQDGMIFRWDIRTYECVGQYSGHRNGVRALIADADVLYSASDDGKVRAWDVYPPTHHVDFRGHTKGVHHLVKTDRHLWSGSEDGTVRIWNPDNSECVRVIGEPHSGMITSMNLVGDKVWTSSAGSIFMWSARDVMQGPVAQYTSNHIGYITNMPVVHRSLMVRVWTTGKEGEIKVWDAECSADYDPDDVLRPQLEKKKQEVCYLKERLSEVEEEYRAHSHQQESRIEKLKDEVSSVQTDLAEKIASLATTKSDLATARAENERLAHRMERHDEKMDELVRELAIERSKNASLQSAHQKELVQTRKDVQAREDAYRDEATKRIAKLEIQLTEANREMAKIEELQKTLDMMDINSGNRQRQGELTQRVHSLIEDNQKQAARIAEMSRELERRDDELAKLKKRRADEGRESGRRSGAGGGDGGDAEAAAHQSYQQDVSPGKQFDAQGEGARDESLARADDDGFGYGEDTGAGSDAQGQLAEIRARASQLEAKLEEERARSARINAQLQQAKGESLKKQLMQKREGQHREGSDGDDEETGRDGTATQPNSSGHRRPPMAHGSAAYVRSEGEDTASDRTGDDMHYAHAQGAPRGEDVHPVDGGLREERRSSAQREAVQRIRGRLPKMGDDPNDWIFDQDNLVWETYPDAGRGLEVGDLAIAEDVAVAHDLPKVREDGLLLYQGEPVEGTNGSWVVQARDGSLIDGSGRSIDVSITDGRAVAHLDEDADEDADGYGGDGGGDDGGYGAREGRRGSTDAERERIVTRDGKGIGLGTPDGTPCTQNARGELVWQERTVLSGGRPVTWRAGERPRDSEGREVVGVTANAVAIVLNEHDDPIVLPAGPDGQSLRAHDGREVVEPLGGRPQLADGTQVVVGRDSRPISTLDGRVAVAGEDGSVVGPQGEVVRGPDGTTPLSVSEQGTPYSGAADQPLTLIVNADSTMQGALEPGTPVSGHDGRPIMGPGQQPVTVSSDGRTIVGPDGKVAVGPDGRPVTVDAAGKPHSSGEPVNVYVTPDGRAVVEGLEDAALHGAAGQSMQQRREERERERQAREQEYRAGVQHDQLRQRVRELESNLEDAHDHLDRALQDLEVERELSRSLKEKVELLSRDFGSGTRDEEMALLQRELAAMAAAGARRDDDMVRRENEHKDQLEHELSRKLALIEQERQEEVNKFRDMVERREESLRIFSEKQRTMLNHIRQLEDNIHQANAEQAMIWEKTKNPSQLPTSDLIYYYRYKEEQYAKIGGLNQELHEENAALMGQTQALTEKLHAMSFVIESRPSLLKVLYDLYKMCVHAKKTIDRFSKEVSVRERSRRELLDNIGSIRNEVVDVMNGEKWLIANMFTEYELLHLGTSPSFFVPDGKRFSRFKPSSFNAATATGTGRWTRTSVNNSASHHPITPRVAESPRPSATSPQEYPGGRPASPQRAEYREVSMGRY